MSRDDRARLPLAVSMLWRLYDQFFRWNRLAGRSLLLPNVYPTVYSEPVDGCPITVLTWVM